MVVKVITPNDLHTDDFAVQNGKVVAVVTRQNFTGTWASGVSPWNNDPLEVQRRAITIQEGFGIVHIDFKRTSRTSVLLGQADLYLRYRIAAQHRLNSSKCRRGTVGLCG